MYNAERDGDFIQKKDLKDKATYIGICRNAWEAQWNADIQKFIYLRTKFGFTYPEEIKHPDDEQRYDVFYPLKVKENADA